MNDNITCNQSIKMKKHIRLVILISCFPGSFSFSEAQISKNKQDVISSAGTRNQSNTFILDWTLGELAITTLKGNSNLLSQGFHQPKFLITSIDELQKGIGEITVYPNPTPDLVQMKMTFDKEKTVQVRLIDASGKQLSFNEYKGLQILESISLRDYANGIYFIKFTLSEDKTTQTFKIQKNY